MRNFLFFRHVASLIVLLSSSILSVRGQDLIATFYPPVIQGSVNPGQSVAIDAAGNRYVVGYFSGVLDFNPGPGLDAKSSAGSSSAFVTRFNADGSYAWTQTFGGAGSAASASGVATDGTSVYATGQFFGSAQIGGAGTAVGSAGGTYDAFVIALNAANGAAKSGWGISGSGIQTFGGSSFDIGYGVATDGTNVYATGFFVSSSAQIGGTGTAVDRVGRNSDAFVIALNVSDGAAKKGWGISGSGIQTFGGTGNDVGVGVATDGTNVYATGSFQSSDAQIGGAGTMIGSVGGSQDAFVIALNASNGAAKSGWGVSGSGIQTLGGTGGDVGSGVATDGTSVFVSGSFNSSDAQIGGTGTAAGSVGATTDAFVIALNASNGAAKSGWGIAGSGIQTFGGTGNDIGSGVTTDGASVYATGSFDSSNAQIGTAGTIVGSVGGTTDAFVIALNASNGAAKSGWGFSGSGIQTFGGTGSDSGTAVAMVRSNVYVHGNFTSTDAGVGGLGIFNSANFGGFLLALDKGTGQTITPAVAPATLPNWTVYQTGYTQTVTSSGGSGVITLSLTGTLPAGLSFTASTGAIIGTPTAAGTFNFTVIATDSVGATGSQAYFLTVAKLPTVVGLIVATPNPSIAGQLVNLTANAAVAIPTGAFAPLPALSGSIVVSENTTALGSGALTNGFGSVVLASLAAGTHSLNVNYSGDAAYLAGSVGVTIDVIAPLNLSSGPVATPNPATAGVVVALTCGSNLDGVTWNWNFGDGTADTSGSASVSHAFSPAGVYMVTVTGFYGATAQTAFGVTTVTVLPQGGGGTPPIPQALTIATKSLRARNPSSQKDVVTLAGLLIPPANTVTLSGPLTINVGSVQQTFTLNALGLGKNRASTFRFRKEANSVAFQAKIIGDFLKVLQESGVSPGTSGSAKITVTITFSGTNYSADITFKIRGKSKSSIGK